jgi:hypothetical protein
MPVIVLIWLEIIVWHFRTSVWDTGHKGPANESYTMPCRVWLVASVMNDA